MFLLKESSRDPGEGVWTLLFSIVSALYLAGIGSLIRLGQRTHSVPESLSALTLLLLPGIAIGLFGGNRWLKRWGRNRRNRRKQSDDMTFSHPEVSKWAAMIQSGQTLSGDVSSGLDLRTAEHRNPSGESILEYAFRFASESRDPKFIESIAWLVNKGARLNSRDSKDDSRRLVDLMNDGHPSTSILLDLALQAGGNPNSIDTDGTPLIHLPGATGAKLEALIRHGVDIHQHSQRQDRFGWTALMSATHFQDWEKANQLLDLGVSPRHSSRDGTTLSHILEQSASFAKSTGRRLPPSYDQLKKRLS